MTLTTLYQAAEQKNMRIHNFHLQAVPAVSIDNCDGSYDIAIDYKQLKDDREEKLVVAHEMGHCETGAFYSAGCPMETIGRIEYRIKRWTVHHLIPPEELCRAVEDGATEPWQLAEYFGVPEELICFAVEYYREQNLLPIEENL